ncbi:MAG: type II secretion system GspH family protein [Nitrospirota bacterium]|nr:type II secretion system GspH family protein [Nitrospirota bacterium]
MKRKNIWHKVAGQGSTWPGAISPANPERLVDCPIKDKTSAKGFTLIETIITLVVLSIAMVGVLSVFTVGSKGGADPLLLNQAISLAQEKMDEAIALRKSGGYAAVAADPGGFFGAPYGAFAWARTVSCVDAALAPAACTAGYKIVTVTVTHAVTGSVSLATLVTEY